MVIDYRRPIPDPGPRHIGVKKPQRGSTAKKHCNGIQDKGTNSITFLTPVATLIVVVYQILDPRDHRYRVLRPPERSGFTLREPRNGVGSLDGDTLVTIHMQQVYRLPPGNTVAITSD